MSIKCQPRCQNVMSGWSVNRGLMESTCINCIEELRPTSWKCWWRSQFFHCIYQPGIKPVNNLQDLFLSLIIIIIDLFPEINLIPGLSLTTAFPGHWKKDPGVCGHVTTQNLRVKKSVEQEGVAGHFDCCCDELGGFQNLRQSLKPTHLYQGS